MKKVFFVKQQKGSAMCNVHADEFPLPPSAPPKKPEGERKSDTFTLHIEAAQTMSDLWRVYGKWGGAIGCAWIEELAGQIGLRVATTLEREASGKNISISFGQCSPMDHTGQTLSRELDGQELRLRAAFMQKNLGFFRSDNAICTLLVERCVNEEKHFIDRGRFSYLVPVTPNLEITIFEQRDPPGN